MRLYDDTTVLSNRHRHLRPRRRRSGGWVRGCLLLFTLGVVGLLVSLLIIAPLLFRALPDQYQGGLARRVPILAAWLPTPTITPTRAYSADTLPTADPARADAAIALLQATDPPLIVTSTPALSGAPTRGALSTMQPAIASPAPSATEFPLPPAVHLDGYTIIYQTWNNCGPANLAQVLNAYGMKTTQKDTAAWLKPNTQDANVSPWQIVTYVNGFTQLRALQRANGSLTLLKRLMAAHFRTLIETGFSLPNEGWMGHYLTPVGYDDAQGALLGFDSYLGPGTNNLGRREPYADLDSRWQHFNRVYIVVYPPEREDELRAILGADADPVANAKGALAYARQEAQSDPSNAYAWFNMGTSYVLLKDYKQAAAAYDQSRNAGNGLPWRMLWYQFGPFAAYYKVGDYNTALQLIEATLGTTKNVEEIYYWRGLVESAQGKTQSALSDLNYALSYDPNYSPAADALTSLKAGNAPAPPDIP